MAVALSLSWLSVVSTFWTAWAWWSVTVMLATASADRQGGELCPPMVCGGVNISFPFGIVDDQATDSSCGVIGFQVLCYNNTPYIGSYYKNKYLFRILDIFYDNSSLLIADDHKLQDFDNSSASKACHSPKKNSSSELGLPLSISPGNQNLIFYNCTEPPAHAVRLSRGLVDTACGNKTLVGVTKGPDVPAGSYFLEGCSATVVPMLARLGAVNNPANYKEFIRGGFLLTWQLTPPSPSPAAFCKASGEGQDGCHSVHYRVWRRDGPQESQQARADGREHRPAGLGATSSGSTFPYVRASSVGRLGRGSIVS